jgi:4'-phosphopantetheinyl transferase EntD
VLQFRPNGTPSAEDRTVTLSSDTPPPLISRAGPLRQLFADPRIVIAEVDPRLVAPGAGLFPEEATSIAHAVDSRRRQFTAGRLLARRAWQELGVAPSALLSDEQRVPVWPAGIVGSITHTQGWCGAVVARAAEVGSVGADVEAASALDPGLWQRVCRPEERDFLGRHDQGFAGLLAKAVFSAKESIYKALYPSVRVFLDFQAMHIELAPGALGSWTWHAELQVPWGAYRAGERFGPGRLGIDAEWIVSGIALGPERLKPKR